MVWRYDDFMEKNKYMSINDSNNEICFLKDYKKKVDYCYSCLQQGKADFLVLLDTKTDLMDFKRKYELYLFVMVHLIHSYCMILSRAIEQRYSININPAFLVEPTYKRKIETINEFTKRFIELWDSPEVTFIRNASENSMYDYSFKVCMELNSGEFIASILGFKNKIYKEKKDTSYQEIYEYGKIIMDRVLGIFEEIEREN